eukprot:849499-Rhodomonas_salina.1
MEGGKPSGQPRAGAQAGEKAGCRPQGAAPPSSPTSRVAPPWFLILKKRAGWGDFKCDARRGKGTGSAKQRPASYKISTPSLHTTHRSSKQRRAAGRRTLGTMGEGFSGLTNSIG